VQHRRIGIERAEFREVPFRHPDAREAVRIGEARAVQNEAILVAGQRFFAAGEEHQTEFHDERCVR
jgi:hypothetical protein